MNKQVYKITPHEDFNDLKEKSPKGKILKFTGSIILMALVLFACRDECRSYSKFSCLEIEKAQYNVQFIYPDLHEVFLGKAGSLSSCKGMAKSFAKNENILREGWDYNCCMIAEGSSCYEKHR
jgi:hypothetical protein